MYRYVKAIEFETAGHMDRDAELYMYTTIADLVKKDYPRDVGLTRTKMSVLVASVDIYEMGKLVLDHTFFGPKPRSDYDAESGIAALVLHDDEKVVKTTAPTIYKPNKVVPSTTTTAPQKNTVVENLLHHRHEVTYMVKASVINCGTANKI
jgi:hypothetical protein